ncbi:MAG: hypothetical protein AAF050_25355 [Cyanobacteria bacterium J06649_5]
MKSFHCCCFGKVCVDLLRVSPNATGPSLASWPIGKSAHCIGAMAIVTAANALFAEKPSVFIDFSACS